MFVSIRGIQIEEYCWFILFTSWLLTHLIYKLGIQFYKSMHSGCSVFATPVAYHFIVCLPIICYPIVHHFMVYLFIICYSRCLSFYGLLIHHLLSHCPSFYGPFIHHLLLPLSISLWSIYSSFASSVIRCPSSYSHYFATPPL